MSAPVTVIIAWDTEFFEKFPKLFRQADARSWFAGNIRSGLRPPGPLSHSSQKPATIRQNRRVSVPVVLIFQSLSIGI